MRKQFADKRVFRYGSDVESSSFGEFLTLFLTFNFSSPYAILDVNRKLLLLLILQTLLTDCDILYAHNTFLHNLVGDGHI